SIGHRRQRRVNRRGDVALGEHLLREANSQLVRIETMKLDASAREAPAKDAQQRPVSAAVVEYALAVAKLRSIDHGAIAFGRKRVVREQARPDLAPVIGASFRISLEARIRVNGPRRHACTARWVEKIVHQRRSNSRAVQSLSGAIDTRRLLALARARSQGFCR